MRIAHVTNADVGRLNCPYCGVAIVSDDGQAIAAQNIWGTCGIAIDEEDESVGLLLLSPDAAYPGQSPHDTGSWSGTGKLSKHPARAYLHRIWVDEAHTNCGIGKRLIQTACAGLLARGIKQLAASAGQPATCGAPPKRFLRHCGFIYVAEERLWLLDISATITDQSAVQNLVGKLISALRPAGRPEPASRAKSP